MIVLVSGGRDYRRWSHARWALDYWHARLGITRLVHNGQVSVDPAEHALPWEERRKWGAGYIAKRWAMVRSIPNVEERISDEDWKKFGLAAEALQNTRVLLKHKPQRLIAFPGGPGEVDILDQARRAGVKCIEVV